MKKLNILLAILLVGVFATSCKKENAKVLPPTKTEQLSKTWKPGKITVMENGEAGNVDQYNGFTIRFTGNQYQVTNGGDAFVNTAGTWEFQNNETNIHLIEEDIVLIVTELNASSLKFNFSRTGGIQEGKINVIPERKFTFELIPA